MSFSRSRRLAILVSHPTQFEAPLYVRMTSDGRIVPTVYFWSTANTNEKVDPELGHPPRWDFCLTEGYDYAVLPQGGVDCWRFLRTEVFSGKYDAILVNGYVEPAAKMALALGVMKGIPIILRGDSTLIYPRPLLLRIAKALVLPLVFRVPTAFQVVGSLSQQYMLHYGVRAEAISFFPYAVNNEYFQKRSHELVARRSELRQALGIPASAQVVLAVTKLVPREGAFDLLKAFALLTDEHKDLWLVIVGDGGQWNLLTQYITANAVPRVIMAGYQPYSRLPEFYTLADLFVHPALVEPWGVSVNEAMACGLPVIVSDKVGSAPDLVRSGENGYVFRAGDITSLRQSLLCFLESRACRIAMGDVSRSIIKQWGYEYCIDECGHAMDYVARRRNPQRATPVVRS